MSDSVTHSEYKDRVITITGGSGVLCSTIAKTLGQRGAKIAIVGRSFEKADTVAAEIRAAGGTAIAVSADVLQKPSVEDAAERIIAEFGRIDVLINGAGGNRAEATTTPNQKFFDLPEEAIRWVFDLNLLGTVFPCQVFARKMVEQDSGVILNISSMAAFRPLTRTIAYSAAKAGINNFTQWLAVHLAQEYSPKIRVNAIAPGFFLTNQNRYLLINAETGAMTERGQTILDHTPQGRFGTPEDLVGAVLWLLSDSASFVHGVVIPIDGGFSAFGGV